MTTLRRLVDNRWFLFVFALMAMFLLPAAAHAQLAPENMPDDLGQITEGPQRGGHLYRVSSHGTPAWYFAELTIQSLRREDPTITRERAINQMLAARHGHWLFHAVRNGHSVLCRNGTGSNWSHVNVQTHCAFAMPDGFDLATEAPTLENFCRLPGCRDVEIWSVDGETVVVPGAYHETSVERLQNAQTAVRSQVERASRNPTDLVSAANAMTALVLSLTSDPEISRQHLVTTIQLQGQAFEALSSAPPADVANSPNQNSPQGGSNQANTADTQAPSSQIRALLEENARLRQARPAPSSPRSTDWRTILLAVLGSSLLTFLITRKVGKRLPAKPTATAPPAITVVTRKSVPVAPLAVDEVEELLKLREEKKEFIRERKEFAEVLKKAYEKSFPKADRQIAWADVSFRVLRDVAERLYELETVWPADQQLTAANLKAVLTDSAKLRSLEAAWVFEDGRKCTAENLELLILDNKDLLATNMQHGERIALIQERCEQTFEEVRRQLEARSKAAEAAKANAEAMLAAVHVEVDKGQQENHRLASENEALRLQLANQKPEPLKHNPFKVLGRLTLPGTPAAAPPDPHNGNGTNHGGETSHSSPSDDEEEDERETTQLDIHVPPPDPVTAAPSTTFARTLPPPGLDAAGKEDGNTNKY